MLMIISYPFRCSTIDLTEEQHSSDENNSEEPAIAATEKYICPAYPNSLLL